MASRMTITCGSALAAVLSSSAAYAMAEEPSKAIVGGASAQVISLSDFVALRETSAWASLRSKLQRWSRLENGWDGVGTIAPRADILSAANSFLQELEDFQAPLPVATIAGDGEVAYEWSQGSGFAAASFADDGHFIAYLREMTGVMPLRIDEPISANAMRPFLERIGAFS